MWKAVFRLQFLLLSVHCFDFSPMTACAIFCLKICHQAQQNNSNVTCDFCLKESFEMGNGSSCLYPDFPINGYTNFSKETQGEQEAMAWYLDFHSMSVTCQLLAHVDYHVMESRPKGSNLPWTFAAIIEEYPFIYEFENSCVAQEFRIGRVFFRREFENVDVEFLPTFSPIGSPHTFILANSDVHNKPLIFNKKTRTVKAELFWKHPEGYRKSAIVRYSIYLVRGTINSNCDIPNSISNSWPIPEVLEDGGHVTFEFPEYMIKQKCSPILQIRGVNICKKHLSNAAYKTIQLDCNKVNVINYDCGAIREMPHCIGRNMLNFSRNGRNSLEKDLEINLSWPEPEYGPPLWYHIRFGEVFRKPVFLGFQWHLVPPIENVKVENAQNATIPYLNLTNTYGFQVCAIYSRDFKIPPFEKLKLNYMPVTCACEGSAGRCEMVKCSDPNEEVDRSAIDFEETMGFVNGRAVRSFQQWMNEKGEIMMKWKDDDDVHWSDLTFHLKPGERCLPNCCEFAKTMGPFFASSNRQVAVEGSIPQSIQDSCKFAIKVTGIDFDGIARTQIFPLTWAVRKVDTGDSYPFSCPESLQTNNGSGCINSEPDPNPSRQDDPIITTTPALKKCVLNKEASWDWNSRNLSWANPSQWMENWDYATLRFGIVDRDVNALIQNSPKLSASLWNKKIPKTKTWHVIKDWPTGNEIYGVQICGFQGEVEAADMNGLAWPNDFDVILLPIPKPAADTSPSTNGALTESELLVLKIMVPICIIVILLTIILVICYCRWKEISEVWKKRQRSSVRTREPSTPAPRTPSIQDTTMFPHLNEKRPSAQSNPYVPKPRLRSEWSLEMRNPALPPEILGSSPGVARPTQQSQSYVRRHEI